MHSDVLKHYLYSLRLQKSYRKYLIFLRSRIVTLIRHMHVALIKQLEQAKESYWKRREQLKKSALEEIRAIFKILKSRLTKENILDDPLIKGKCKSLESILNDLLVDGGV